jgi:hypothetical protein
MSQTIAVFITTRKFGLPHLKHFREYNPDVPAYYLVAEENPDYGRGWRNCDRNIKDWWMCIGSHLDFGYAVFIEGDVLFAASIDQIFSGESQFMGKDVKKPGMPWNWFSHVSLLPEALKEHVTGLAPLAVMRFGRMCLEAMFSHPEVEVLYGREIFCELRLATLASACGYEPENHRGALSNLEFYPIEPSQKGGVWHCVKKPVDLVPEIQ